MFLRHLLPLAEESLLVASRYHVSMCFFGGVGFVSILESSVHGRGVLSSALNRVPAFSTVEFQIHCIKIRFRPSQLPGPALPFLFVAIIGPVPAAI